MYSELRLLLNKISPTINVNSDTEARKLYDNLVTLLCDRGMINSIVSGRPLDNHNKSLPWYTYASIDYLDQLDFSECHIIEFGSGYSTLYWSSRAKSVTSIERDEMWYSEVSKSINSDNIDLHLLTDKDEYFNFIDTVQDTKYDVIIIDGKDRYDTLEAMHNSLQKGGILIFDNSDWYPGSCSFLRDYGYTQIDFTGFGPINNYTWCTSIFFTKNIAIPHSYKLDFIGRLDVIKDDDLKK